MSHLPHRPYSQTHQAHVPYPPSPILSNSSAVHLTLPTAPHLPVSPAANGQVLTNLGAWTVQTDGEIALKMAKDGPGCEVPMTCLDLFRGIAERFGDACAMAVAGADGQWQVSQLTGRAENPIFIIIMVLVGVASAALSGCASTRWGGTRAGRSGFFPRSSSART